MLRRPPSRRSYHTLAAVLIGSAFVLMGVGITWKDVVYPLWQQRAARSWIEATCAVERSEVASKTDSDGDTTYWMRVRYRLDRDGAVYIGSRYRFWDVTGASARSIEPLVKRYPAGAHVTCYHDPDDPSELVLDRSRGDIGMPLVLGPGLAGLGLGAVLFALSRRPRRRWRVRRAGERYQLLRPSALGEALFVGGFALIIDSATVGFVFAGEWGLVTALGILVLGFLSIVLTVAALRRWALLLWPKMRVSVDRLDVRAGSSLHVDWRVRSPTLIDRLHIQLVAREEATHQSGSSDVTDTSVFHRVTLADVGESFALEGQALVALPGDAPPPFAGEHNRVRWLIELAAVVEFWPDTRGEFDLAVAPAEPAGGGPDAATVPSPAGEPPPGGGFEVHLAREHYRPGETVAGIIRWSRPQPPAGGELRLVWTSAGKGDNDREVVGYLPLAELPAVAQPPQAGAPYREMAATGEAGPLQACDRRAFRFLVPAAPWTFSGTLMSITWAIEVELDGEQGRRELVVSPTGYRVIVQEL